MDAGDLYYLGRRLKALAEVAFGAQEGEVDAVPASHRLILGAVLESPGSSIGDIACSTGLVQSAVSSAVAALREQQLVLVEPDANDRRVTRVRPAPRLAVWAEDRLHADAEHVLAPLLAEWSGAERRRVFDSLALLHEAFVRGDEASGRHRPRVAR
jgi:DNA-binding MarR family transcriptional regulator